MQSRDDRYWIPTVPVTPIDIINRHAAATGSVGYAMATAHADYNGHEVTVSFKEHAVSGPTWNAEYWFGERVVLARGGLERCAAAAAQYMARGAHGSVAYAHVHSLAPESQDEQAAILARHGFVRCPEGEEKRAAVAWRTGTHTAVSDALNWQNGPFSGLLQVALAYTGAADEWPATRQAWIEAKRQEWKAARG